MLSRRWISLCWEQNHTEHVLKARGTWVMPEPCQGLAPNLFPPGKITPLPYKCQYRGKTTEFLLLISKQGFRVRWVSYFVAVFCFLWHSTSLAALHPWHCLGWKHPAVAKGLVPAIIFNNNTLHIINLFFQGVLIRISIFSWGQMNHSAFICCCCTWRGSRS